jgi:hypothetical protein
VYQIPQSAISGGEMLTVVACVVQCIGDHRGGMAGSDAVSTQALYVAECVLLLRVYFIVFSADTRQPACALSRQRAHCSFNQEASKLQSNGCKACRRRHVT